MNISSAFLSFLFSFSAFAFTQNMVADVAFAKSAPQRPQNEFTMSELKNSKQPLLTIASEMNVEKIKSYNPNPSLITPQDIANSMILKMKENPRWDKILAAENVKNLKTQEPLIKATFSEKTYAWAWFKKQFGETQVAKQILQTLFKEAYTVGVEMTHRGFGYTNPLTELDYIKQALEPLSTAEEKRDMAQKIQKVKTIYSNLPPSNIQTLATPYFLFPTFRG